MWKLLKRGRTFDVDESLEFFENVLIFLDAKMSICN